MHQAIALYFFVVAVILLGLLYIAYPQRRHQVHSKPSLYWSLALAFDVFGLVAFALYFLITNGLVQTHWIGTFANTGLFASYVYQTLNFRSLRQEITHVQQRIAWIAVLVFGVLWQITKEMSTPNDRVLYFGLSSVLLLIWQIAEARKNKQTFANSLPLKVVVFTVNAELVLTVVRVVSFAGLSQPLLLAEQLPMLAVAATWFQYAFKTVAYAAINGYWAEVIAAEKARADFENEQFRVLSAKQEKLIADLGRLNKAATAGVLTASIAHELNQPLQSAVLNHDMLEREFGAVQADREAVAQLLADQMQNLTRMSAIVQTMRGVFGETAAKPRIVALHKLVEDLTPLITPQARKHGIELQYQHAGDGRVSVNASEIQQVILNLLGNAFDILIERQTLRPTVRIQVIQEGEWVTCTVEDNGPGIDEAQHEEVFKILKSTKNAGMGLGLWLSRYITQRHHGSISVGRSELGGAKLTLRFARA